MSWELAAKLGNEAVSDVAWASTANGHDEYIASAQGTKVVLWRLTGYADKVQVQFQQHLCSIRLR